MLLVSFACEFPDPDTLHLQPPNSCISANHSSYLTGSYQASFVLTLSLITSNTAGQSKKMIVSGMIWFGACIGNIAGPFFYLDSQAPSYQLGIGSLLTCNILELIIFIVFRYSYKWENKRKEKARSSEPGRTTDEQREELNSTAFTDLTDKQNPNFTYVY